MKKLLIAFTLSLGLMACSSSEKVNLVHSQQPIVNISAGLASLIEVNASQSSASVKNISQQPVKFAHYFFWYDKNGVTQGNEPNLKNPPMLSLAPREKIQLRLQPPTTESINYRLYLGL